MVTDERMRTTSKQSNGASCPSYISYCLKSETFIMSFFQLVVQQYELITVQKHIFNWKIQMISIVKGSHQLLLQKLLSTKIYGTQSRMQVSS